MLLQGKVVVIFGGSGAIGSAMARESAQVHLVARHQDKLDRAARRKARCSNVCLRLHTWRK